jgi:hypothetical protein
MYAQIGAAADTRERKGVKTQNSRVIKVNRALSERTGAKASILKNSR